MIHIKIFINSLKGLNLLIEKKLNISPRGNENSNVSANSLTVVPNPASKSNVTLINVSIFFPHYRKIEAEQQFCLITL